jgi:hypothetical protein
MLTRHATPPQGGGSREQGGGRREEVCHAAAQRVGEAGPQEREGGRVGD